MGQLAASISHEINQPIGSVRNNAHAALRLLAREPPDLAEAREALDCVIRETQAVVGGPAPASWCHISVHAAGARLGQGSVRPTIGASS
jgi:signal transduction histidine kinase